MKIGSQEFAIGQVVPADVVAAAPPADPVNQCIVSGDVVKRVSGSHPHNLFSLEVKF